MSYSVLYCKQSPKSSMEIKRGHRYVAHIEVSRMSLERERLTPDMSARTELRLHND